MGCPAGARCADAQSFEAVQHVVLAAVPFLERLHGIRDRRAGRVDGHGMLLRDRREGVVAEGA